MDFSITTDSYSSSPMSSQTILKRSRSFKTNQSKPPKRRKTNNNHARSKSADENEDDMYNYQLSAETRDAVLKLKRIKDPFDNELQQVVDDVFDHLNAQTPEDVDLAESGLLLSSVTHVFCSQIKSLHEDILAFAARVSGKEPPQKNKNKRKASEEASATEVDASGNTSGEQAVDPEQTSSSQSVTEGNEDSSGLNNNDAQTNDAGVTELKTETENPNESLENSSNAMDLPGATDIVNLPNAGDNDQSIIVIENENETEKPCDLEINAENENQELNEEVAKKLEVEIFNEMSGRCTRRQSERLKVILKLEKTNDRDYKLKKKKLDEDPPDLMSCYEELMQIEAFIAENGDINIDEALPPLLEIQVGRRRKKVTINNNDLPDCDDNDNDECKTCLESQASTDGDTANNNSQEPDSDLTQAISMLTKTSDCQKYETLDHLSNDVQERFHDLVDEMQRLPFDYGLMQHDMFKAYQQKFLQAVTLLSNNSVLVKRTPSDAASDPNPEPIKLSDSQLSETDQTISSIAELLSQVRLQASEEFHKGKQSKSDADIPVSQMIATLKRIICSRYKKWHVRTDNDKAVFRRIKEFEDKVKCVLKKEAQQGIFDVKKYEMEVMDVTRKESLEAENDEFGCPLSPTPSQSGAESPRSEDMRNWNLCGSSRRSSVNGSIDGSGGWIRLVDIFSHMKKIDHSETCRHFYAVLALLSHKNLSVNFDTLFSQESAKLITKFLKRHGHNVNMDKYPVGAKIMTSRCPDIDRDELFLAPTFNAESFQHVLEQDGYVSVSSGYQSDSQASSSTSGMGVSYIPPKTIAEAISEFVPDPGEPYVDDIFTRRRRKH